LETAVFSQKMPLRRLGFERWSNKKTMEVFEKFDYFKNLPQAAVNKMQAHFNLLSETGKHTNLTAISDPSEVVKKHFLDSLAGLDFVKNGDKVLDVGTGAGFPSLPLAAVKSEAEFWLMDATKKKTDFLKTVILQAGYANAHVLNGRAEELAFTSLRASFDSVVSRAVKPLNVLLELCTPFLRLNGTLIAYKALNAEKEVKDAKNALKTLNAEVAEIKSYTLFDYTRSLVIIKKTGKTGEGYPRSYANMMKKPL
jgi:16S rRNA (guanine527-N7)-methyltransferase